MKRIRLEGLCQFCQPLVSVSSPTSAYTLAEERTLDLFVPLPVQSADLCVLLLEHLQTPCKGVRDLEVPIRVAARLAVVERSFHLPDLRDHALRLVNHLLLLRRYEADLVVQGIGKSCEDLPRMLSARKLSQEKAG